MYLLDHQSRSALRHGEHTLCASPMALSHPASLAHRCTLAGRPALVARAHVARCEQHGAPCDHAHVVAAADVSTVSGVCVGVSGASEVPVPADATAVDSMRDLVRSLKAATPLPAAELARIEALQGQAPPLGPSAQEQWEAEAGSAAHEAWPGLESASDDSD